MAITTSSFEKLGAFYLGRPYDLETKSGEDVPLLYDSRDLLTHAVCVGMTGSGKTGLCLALLEEAAMDGIPAILIDPKGDLANLMLTFPELEPEDFLPWVNPDDAARKGQLVAEFASDQAKLWRDGLAKWGQGPDRIKALKANADVTIFTPGSTSGVPVNVLASFDPPATTDPEELGDSAQNAAAGLLGLLKINADPFQSREGIFLSTLFTTAWQAGEGLSLESLIERIQRPPFSKVGVLDLETFFPAKDRFALVMALNNILASPAFSAWREGAPLDISKTLYTPEGKPRLAIFSIAHLGDDERMFFVARLLNEVVSWTRSQSGTTSLRAILYMDEIFGYLPPTANPPSKRPMLTLLKQARAFGVGVVLATQNPVDLDYKALSNAGTWFIGRLQTERDKARVLDGLQGANAGGNFDRAKLEALLAGLGNRIFLMNNVHDDGPTLFETRWVMSYLRGPLTKDQIRLLTKVAAPEPVDPGIPRPNVAVISTRPALPPGIPEFFLSSTNPTPHYHPALIGTATLSYSDTKSGFKLDQEVALAAELSAASSLVDWGSADDLPMSQDSLGSDPAPNSTFEEVPASVAQRGIFATWEKAFKAWLSASRTVEVFVCKELREVSTHGESLADFRTRLTFANREARDTAVEALRKKFSQRRTTLTDRIIRAEATLDRQKQQASAAKLNTLISVGSSILGAFLGRKAISATNINRVGTAARGVNRTMKESSEAAVAGQSLETLRIKLAELEEEFAAEAAAISTKEPIIDTITLKPKRGGVNALRVVLGWIPS